MNKFQLYRLLRKNTNLSYKRSPAFEQNKWAKLLIYLGAGMFALYLIMYGCIVGMAAKGEAGMMLAFAPFYMAIDFLLRFIVQTTPGMMVKPYILQPISRYTAIECFLIGEHVSGYNLLWLCMFVPYSIIQLFAGESFALVLLELVTCELLMILNSQIYLFFRTLINRSVLWLIPGLVFYALPFTPLMLSPKADTFDKMVDMIIAQGLSWYALPIVLLVICGLFFVNRHMQFIFVYEEISKKTERALKHVSEFAFFNRFGLIGEYLKIELKSNIRNKTMRTRCIYSLCAVIAFSLLVAYTTIYDSELMQNFWCLYCFALYGVTALIKIMGQEGNYIELLMMHRENIIALLRAKFIFYSAVLIIPFVIMLPAVFTGKYTILMLFAYMLLTAGFLHFVIFQLAVYNKQTLPLQLKVTAKGNFENGMQLVIELFALFGPVLITGLGYLLVGLTYTYIFMCIVGLAFIIAHPIWIRNIYTRMMKRRYENLEGFMNTRDF
ncbi:hypothetical protein SAMN04488493_102139 [Xylanibacter ruminicola]|jgi:hypothetical protein|uniref:DUF5687 family protein n=1 Tax=Xylanibacter ruminicola TaxID=839 RepID=UPI0008EBF231|nr:DUF5687 family protein [Xylanibacter ruminicola]MBR0187442.1 hypothetical protein [Prevotella sp.]SFB91009.1 hypothetical protein SAMN04488493_102139 [Xylanibacter ruminicola]